MNMVAAERDMALRHQVAAEYARLNDLNPVTVPAPGARIGIVAPGKTYYDLREALELLGLDDLALDRAGIRIKKVSVLFPIAAAEWREFGEGVDTVIVVEEKRPLLEVAVKEAWYGDPGAPRVLGKSDAANAILPAHGEFGPDLLADSLRPVLRNLGVTDLRPPKSIAPGLRTMLPLATARTGFFCSGCPHSTGLKAPEDAKVGAGIGCHILGLIVDRDEYGDISGYTQMGGEGAQWIGMAPFVSTEHMIQNVGDGTFHHSASLAIRWAIAAEVNITFKLLYNSVVGMTGGQDVSGGMAVPEIVKSLFAEGVSKVVITTDEPNKYKRRSLPRGVKVRPRDEIVDVQRELADHPGVTVLIHDQQCAADRRRHIKEMPERATTKVLINDRVCEGCGDCNAKSQCLSVQPIETEFGRKTAIHQSSCNVDYACMDGDCPSFLQVDTKNAKKTKRSIPAAPAVPEPAISRQERFAVHMAGIGGTGVISVSNIIAEAALIEGRRTRSLDLTGGTIKAGPVISQVQVFPEGEPEPSASIEAGAADVLLAFDLLAMMTPDNLAPLSPERTVVVASSSQVPNAEMAIDPSTPYPAFSQLRSIIDDTTRAGANQYFDAQALALAITGNHMSGNALMLGAAVQTGALPLQPTSVEEAIRRQGVAVESTLAAFAWGRAIAADPGLVDALLPEAEVTEQAVAKVQELRLPAELGALITRRYVDLVGFQSGRYADTWLRRVQVVADQDRQHGDGTFRVTTAVVENLHKLMAYKDEYEVARLHLDSVSAAEQEFGEGAKVSYKLHPRS
nr:indolepyruvate ferredoxin oxidoreductase family protein [Nocardioides alcanivorans]